MFAIDVNTFFGVLPTRKTDYSLATLARLMAGRGIAAALTLSLRGIHDDHVSGNAETLAACRANPRLLPVAACNPRHGLGLGDDIAQIRAGGFRAVRFDTTTWADWTPDSLSFRRILEGLAPLGLPIMAEVHSGDFAARLARAVAEVELPLVVMDTDRCNQSEVTAIAQRYSQVYVDTSHLAGAEALDILAREIGVEHILYGSGMPANNPQPGLNAVLESDLTVDQKAQILAGNALRLFGVPQAALQPQPEEASFRGYAGPKIDVHAHVNMGTWSFQINSTGTADILRRCRRLNIEHVIASSWQGIAYDMEAGNREMKAAIDSHPELRGYVVVNAGDIERSCAEMDRYYRFDNWVGAKIHCPFSGQPTAGKPMRALFAEVARRGRPVLIHVDGEGWAEAIREYALAHPRLSIIIAHGPYTPAFADLPNVHFEFAKSDSPRDRIAPVLAAVGPERLLFGTDQDVHNPAWILGQYYEAGLTPEQEEMIMYKNAKRLFEL